MLAPDSADIRRSPARLVTGMMPGTTGAEMPAAKHRSRNRRKTAVSKKKLVIARLLPRQLALQIVEIGHSR